MVHFGACSYHRCVFSHLPLGRAVNAPTSRWNRAGDARFAVSLRGPRGLQHVADGCQADVDLCPGTRLRAREKCECHTLSSSWAASGRCTSAGDGDSSRSTCFSRRICGSDSTTLRIHLQSQVWHDFAGGRAAWTLQLGHPPPRERRTPSSARESYPRDHGLLAEEHRRGKAAHHRDLGLGPKIATRVKVVGDHHRAEPMHPEVGPTWFELRAHWITGWALADSTTSSKYVEFSGRWGERFAVLIDFQNCYAR